MLYTKNIFAIVFKESLTEVIYLKQTFHFWRRKLGIGHVSSVDAFKIINGFPFHRWWL